MPSRFEVCAGAVVVPDLDKPRQGRVVPMRPARIVALLPAAAQNVLRGRDWRRRRGRPRSEERDLRRLLRSDDQRSPLARQGSRRCRTRNRKEGRRHQSELQIRCPRPEPPGLDQLRRRSSRTARSPARSADEEPSSSERRTHERSSGSPRRARGGGHADIGCGGGA